jgi:tetratricopeptide (TPR) repeat protein
LIGPDALFTLRIEGLQAKVHSYLGNLDESISYLENLVQKRTKILGPTHVETLASEEDLSRCYLQNKQKLQALELQNRVFDKSKQALGPKHPVTIEARKKLGRLLSNLGRGEQGIELISTALEDTIELLGESHHKSISVKVALSSAYRENVRLEEAESLGNEALKGLRELYGEGHTLTTVALASLAATFSAQGRPGLGLPLMKEALDISVKDSGTQSQQSTLFQSEYTRIAAEMDKAEKGFD